MNKSEYVKYAEGRAKKSKLLLNCTKAFAVGGSICLFAEWLTGIYLSTGMTKENASAAVTVTLIFLTALATGFGFFDRLAKHAGAGTVVPITGFANAMVSPAIDTKAEGFVLGVGAKIFTIAGPVILYGTVASIIYGVIYWAMQSLS